MNELHQKLLQCPIKDLAPALGISEEQLISTLIGISQPKEETQYSPQQLDIFYGKFAYRTARLLKERSINPDTIYNLTANEVLSWNTAGTKTWIDITNYLVAHPKNGEVRATPEAVTPDPFLSNFPRNVSKFLSHNKIGPDKVSTITETELLSLKACKRTVDYILSYQKKQKKPKVLSAGSPLEDVLAHLKRKFPVIADHFINGYQESLRVIGAEEGVSFERVRQVMNRCRLILSKNLEFNQVLESVPKYLESLDEYPYSRLVAGYRAVSNYDWVYAKHKDYKHLLDVLSALKSSEEGLLLSSVGREESVFLIKTKRAEISGKYLRATIPYLSKIESICYRIVKDHGKPLHRDEIQTIAEDSFKSLGMDPPNVKSRLHASGLKNQGKSGMWGLPEWVPDSRSAKQVCIDLLKANGPMSSKQIEEAFIKLGRNYKARIAAHLVGANPDIFFKDFLGRTCLTEWGGAPVVEDPKDTEDRFVKSLNTGEAISLARLETYVKNHNRLKSYLRKYENSLELFKQGSKLMVQAKGPLNPDSNLSTIEGRLYSEISEVLKSLPKGTAVTAQELKSKLSTSFETPVYYKVLAKIASKNPDVEKVRKNRQIYLTRK